MTWLLKLTQEFTFPRVLIGIIVYSYLYVYTVYSDMGVDYVDVWRLVSCQVDTLPIQSIWEPCQVKIAYKRGIPE